MKMLFDVGNTRIKAAISNHGRELRSLPDCGTHQSEFPSTWSGIETPEAIFIASVAAEAPCERIAAWAESSWHLKAHRVKVKQNVGGMRTAYKNPAQLGVDRWLAALGAYQLADQQAVCVIDAGTALTVDVVDKSGLHRGGLIAPGFNLMIESLTKNTERLELENISVPDIFALDTESAISLGCADYVTGMLNRVAKRLKTLNLNVNAWFITGGQGAFVSDLSEMDLSVVPDLVLQGIDVATETEK